MLSATLRASRCHAGQAARHSPDGPCPGNCNNQHVGAPSFYGLSAPATRSLFAWRRLGDGGRDVPFRLALLRNEAKKRFDFQSITRWEVSNDCETESGMKKPADAIFLLDSL